MGEATRRFPSPCAELSGVISLPLTRDSGENPSLLQPNGFQGSEMGRSSTHRVEGNESGPVGLALSGGGARGAYQLGSWLALRDHGIEFDAIAGSSIGALNGALVCQADAQSAISLWRELARLRSLSPDPEKIGKLARSLAIELGILLTPIPSVRILRALKYLAWASRALARHGSAGRLLRDGLWSATEIKEMIRPFLNMRTVIHQEVDLFVTALGTPRMSSPMGQGRWFRLQDLSETEAWNAVLASMALPLLLPPVEVAGVRHLDGGLVQWLPLHPLYEHGCRCIVAVSTRASVRLKQTRDHTTRIIVIRPEKPLGRFPWATLRFKEQTMERWIEQGRRDTDRVLAEEGIHRGLC